MTRTRWSRWLALSMPVTSAADTAQVAASHVRGGPPRKSPPCTLGLPQARASTIETRHA